jgi:hypothetical protein
MGLAMQSKINQYIVYKKGGNSNFNVRKCIDGKAKKGKAFWEQAVILGQDFLRRDGLK